MTPHAYFTTRVAVSFPGAGLQELARGQARAWVGALANLFYGTGIPACIIVLDTENAAGRAGVFMLDASKGFRKDGNKNRLREQDIHRIVDTFNRQVDVPRFARLVPFDEIADPKNDFNLNLPRYIDTSGPEDLQDIDAHLRGGIPERDIDALAAHWQVLPGVRDALFESAGRAGYARLKPPLADVKAAILGHAEFTTFRDRATGVFTGWRAAVMPRLTSFDKDMHAKPLVEDLAESLLAACFGAPLIDACDIYQHLMDYWAETMQDDAYLIAGDGWVARPARVVETDKKGRQRDKGWACDLVPKPFIVSRYFAAEQGALNAKQAELEAASAELAELEEEHGGEDGVIGALERIGKAEVNARLKEIKGDKESEDEAAVLRRWLDFSEKEAALSSGSRWLILRHSIACSYPKPQRQLPPLESQTPRR